MWVNFVVVCEPSRQLVEDGTGVGFGADPGIIALQCPDERLGHAVRLRAFDRRGSGHETDVSGEPTGVVGSAAATVVGQRLIVIPVGIRQDSHNHRSRGIHKERYRQIVSISFGNRNPAVIRQMINEISR